MAKHKLDELFSDGLENFEPTPSTAAWEAIDNQLDKKKGRSYWAWAGIAASALLVLTSSWLIFSQSNDAEPDLYEYAEVPVKDLAIPTEVVYVPIYIYTVVEQPTTNQIKPMRSPQPVKTQVTEAKAPVILAEREEIPVERPEIIALDDVPVIAADEIIIASAELPAEEQPASLQPVTIIYKQGEPAEESNFVKAMNYMEEVRMGEKKLVNFDKIRENFRSKFRSAEGTD